MIWSGEKSGEGSQEIIESVPDSLVRTQLDFGFMGQPKAAFILAGEGAGTKVTWAFDAVHGYNVLDRYFGKFMVETEVGKMYESGLVDLKAFIEAKAAAEKRPPMRGGGSRRRRDAETARSRRAIRATRPRW